MKRPKVSVVIPVYKAEPYIERCVRTLFGQTLDDLEYVFVDDCSPDRSIEVMERVLAEYPERKSQVKVIRHEVNQGVSSTRQHGVDAATGEYIIHCDPDDWVELNMYEALYAEAKAKQADIVICDFYTHQNGKETIEFQEPEKLDSISVLEGISGRSFHKLHGSLCNKLISSACYTNVAFYTDISYCEDAAILFQILSNELSISYLPKGLYHYRTDVPGSLVKQFNSSAIECDIKLINHLQTFRTPPTQRLNDCIDSMIIGIIFNRMIRYRTKSSINLNSLFSKYKSYIAKNRQLSRFSTLILRIGMSGHTRITSHIFILKYELMCLFK